MLYRPQLSSGEPIPILWPIATYRLVNIVCWPLRDGAGVLVRGFDRFCWLLAFFVFAQHNDAELRYLVENVQNLDEMLSGVPTYLVLVEIQLRAFQLGWNKERFKRFLQKFYAEIYIPKSEQPELYVSLRRQLRPVFAFCALYFNAMGSYVATAVYYLIYNYRFPIYKMTYPFDIMSIWIYVPIVLSNIWVGFIVTSMIIGEDCVLCEVLMHLSARFQLIQRNLLEGTAQLLERTDATRVTADFERLVVNSIQKCVRLNRFAIELQKEFTYRIFIMLAFSATMLCALGFKVYTNPFASYTFFFWMCAKILEMLLIGEFGSMIIATTNNVSSMYYESNWELVIQRSPNSCANVRVMRLILMALETSRKPFVLMGFNFFSVSLTAVLTILQGAGSYFTCLISVR